MKTPPHRLRIEAALGYSLLNWQWCAILSVLGFPATLLVPIDTQVMTEPATPKPVRRDEDQDRTCELCGRAGTRRFIPTETGWRCSPSATKCSGNRAANLQEAQD